MDKRGLRALIVGGTGATGRVFWSYFLFSKIKIYQIEKKNIYKLPFKEIVKSLMKSDKWDLVTVIVRRNLDEWKKFDSSLI